MPLPLLYYLYGSGLGKYLRQNEDGQGSWALVTGASDGIGLGFAEELCERGFNVVLHGRNAAKLERVRSDLGAAHPGRQFRIVTADASSFDRSDIQRIASAVEDLPLTVLINNVGGTGVLSSNFKAFGDCNPQEIDALFSLNQAFTMQLTLALLPALRRQKPALVMSCSSQAHIGMPFLSAYSGTKAALHGWTRGLAAEQKFFNTDIEAMEMVVGSVHTKQMEAESSGPTWFMPSARTMAKSALARVGCGQSSVVGYFPHRLQGMLLYLLPASLADSLTASILNPKKDYAKKAR